MSEAQEAQYDLTANFRLKKPWLDADNDVWGAHLNQNMDLLDNLLNTRGFGAGYLPLEGGALTGPLILNADPTAALGAATKSYVDTHSAGGGGPFLLLSGGTMTGALTLVADPTAALDAATKQYVDGAVTRAGGPFLALGGGVLTGPLTLAANPTAALGAATKQYVDQNAGAGGPFLKLTGGTLTGPLTLAADPIVPLGAATKQYVDRNAGAGASDYINIKTAYGARGDGVTDDTAAINAMIAGVPAGAAVFWPAGTYKVSSLITVGKSMTWLGAGRLATTVSISLAAASLFTFNACVNISDMGFTCSATAASGVLLTYNTGATRFRLKNFWLSGFYSGIAINGPSDIMLIDGQIFNWAIGGTAILYVGGEAAVMDNLIVEQGVRPGNGNGLVVRNGGIQLINCEIMACGTCLALAPGNGQAVVSMWVCNTAFDNAANGILFQPTGNGVVARNWFIGCWMCSMDNSGVTMSSPTVGSINGTDFVNCHVFGNGLHGFNLTDNRTVNTSWLNCQIAGNTDTGIQMFAGAQNFSIIGCRIGAYGEFGNNGTGAINLGGSSTYYRVTDNDLSNGGINPLYGAGVQNGTNPGVNELIHGNIGYVDSNRGGGSVAAGQLSVVVAHGLSGTPTLHDIFLTDLTGMGNPPQASAFVISPDASTFTIEIGIALGFTCAFAWSAKLPCTP